MTKAQLWRDYKAASPSGQRVVRLTSFRALWKQLLPYVVIGRPMSDLCWVCQCNNTHILRAVNVPEEMKSATLLRQEEHLRLATRQRTEYQAMCAACVELAEHHNITELGKSENPPSTFNYSFDFAQQLHYHANPVQPGPIFFKTPRKMQFFAVHDIVMDAIVTDRHPEIQKWVREKLPMVNHYDDVWHVAKGNIVPLP